jgi:outer membrane cobalamin receptor
LVNRIYSLSLRISQSVLLVAAVLALGPALVRAQQPLEVRVIDPQGAPIASARVEVRTDPADPASLSAPAVLTRDNGTARVDGRAGQAIVVASGGFDEAIEPWPVSLGTALVITLRPAGLAEQVSVTAGRRVARGTEVPADTTVLQARDIESVGAAVVDDVLRLTPGFTLFRRNSSRSANPTTQGVTLRGLSASGASRTLVLADGVPLNDPFGGWVSWTRVPVVSIDRIEVVRGGSSDLYGADAAGGVIQIVSAEPRQPTLRLLAEAGSQATGRVSALGGLAHRGWRGFTALEAATTEGGIPIAPEVRGPVDTPAGNDSRVLSLAVLSPTAGTWRGSVRGGIHDEDRTNGTPLQDNDTNQRQVSADAAGRVGTGDLRLRAFGAGQSYNQSFTAVNAPRTGETLTLRQDVRSGMTGGAAEYVGMRGAVTWLGGTDVRRVSGDLDERNAAGVLTSTSGSQTFAGVFGQATWVPGAQWIVVGGLRGDHIDTDTSLAGTVTQSAWSPKASVAWAPRADLSVRGSVFRAFRAPTLNERLRSFRVGNVITQNNPELQTERVAGADVSVQVERATHSWRVTGFSTQLDDAITNVTLTSTPTLITRQRRNAGTIEARGVEAEGQWRPFLPVRVTAALTLTRARFSDAVEPGLAGLTVPQVPRAQGAIDVRWQVQRDTAVSAQTRFIGRQFDDDRNAFTLDDAVVVDLLAERRLTSQSRLFVAVENAFDADYDTGRTPQRTVGLPRRVRAGVRVNVTR